MPGALAPFYFSPESKYIPQPVVSETLGLRKTSDDPPTSLPRPFLPFPPHLQHCFHINLCVVCSFI